MDKIGIEDKAFELISYMSVSARNLLAEPARYGPFRLVDAASRLVDLLREAGLSSKRMEAVQRVIERGKYSAMDSEQAYEAYLDSVVLEVVGQITD